MKRLLARSAIRPLLTVAALTGLLSMPAFAVDLQREDVQRFANDLAREHKIDRAWIDQILTSSQKQQSILDAISRPAEAVKPWSDYRAIFITPERVKAGVAFYAEHKTTLEQIEAKSGVSIAMILGIVGVESYYGRITGKYRVIDALTTLGFDYPPRETFFRRELGEAFLLARDENLNLDELMGSYAGAMGPPQFIPSSYRAYAVDGDGDGRRDLISSWPDILASVANYFAVHKWKSGQPVAAMATLSKNAASVPYQNKLELSSTIGALSKSGVLFSTELGPDAPAGVWKLEGANGTENWVGFNNLYAITRYNRSVMYALAAWQLGDAVMRESAQ